MRKSVYFVLVLAALGALSMQSIAYAEEVNLPFEKMYDAKGAKIQFYFNSTDVRVIYWFDYTFPKELIEAMPSPIDSPSDYEHMKAVEIFIEEEKEAILKVLTEEALSISTDDRREEIINTRPPTLPETEAIAEELCFGGEEVEQQIHFPNETVNISREFDGNIRNDIDAYRDAKNSEFCIAYQKARSLGYDFVKIQEQDPGTSMDLDFTEYFKAQKTASVEEMESATTVAEAYMCSEEGKRRGLCRALEDPGFTYGGGEHKVPEIRATCFPKPSNPIELMCPLRSVTSYLDVNIVAEEVAIAASRNAALVIACANSWDRTDSGQRDISQWEPMLLDDTCLKHIPELWKIRFEAER